MVVHKQASMEMVTALMHNPPLLYVVSWIAVVAGLALVLGHNVWSGGAVPVIVTLIGWVTLVKALLLLFLSPEAASEFFLGGFHYVQGFYWYAGFSILTGIFLTYMSIASKERGGAA